MKKGRGPGAGKQKKNLNNHNIKMKIKILSILTIIVCSINLYGQWISQTSGTTDTLLSISFPFNVTTGYCAGVSGQNGVVVKTTNGGVNWIYELLSSNIQFRTVHFPTLNNGWVAGFYNNNGIIMVTTNGGTTWSTQFTGGLIYANFNCIRFVNILKGWAVTSLGMVYSTTNGGTDWSYVVTSAGNNSLNSISFANLTTGWIVGQNSSILKTTNAGINWLMQTVINVTGLNGVDCINDAVCWAVGDLGRVIKTTNGGSSWFQQLVVPAEKFTSVNFIDLNTGWVTSSNGSIRATTNGGANWIVQSSGVTTPLRYVVFPMNNGTGWVCGVNGKLLKTINGGFTGIEKISSEIPHRFSLLQNYPNPFNPVTQIKFQIAKFSNAKLVVFDALGREVETLVNEQLKPGTYEAEFEGSKYSSGIYFYKLIAENYTETKKMILTK